MIDKAKLLKMARDRYALSTEELKYVVENRDAIQVMLDEQKFVRDEAHRLVNAASDLLSAVPPDIVFDKAQAYYSRVDENRTSYNSMTSDRSAQVYLNAHNGTTWGLHLIYVSSANYRMEKWGGKDYPTREAAEEQAISWVVNGYALSDSGKRIVEP